jgi:phosphatidylinositol alpha-1,6-mannosyltransferase
VSHLLVTNDFPPKLGGIQSYLWELWRRLPPGEATVLTTPWPGSAAFDAAQPFAVVRVDDRVLLPTPNLRRKVTSLARDAGAGLVVLDPALPVGLLGPRLELPYAVVVHGAEITVPGRLPAVRRLLAKVLRGAEGIVSAGGYPAAEAARAVGGSERMPPTTLIPPGVDVDRFRVLSEAEQRDARARFGLAPNGRLIVSVSRLVPRKGMDVLVAAAAALAPGRPDLTVAIAGAGRDAARLARRVQATGAPGRFLGRVPDEDLPALYGCADVFAMLCRDRWGGLEQEGFGIVFLEAAACGVAQVAGDSGGAAEAVLDGVTGLVVRRPAEVADVTAGLAALLDAPETRVAMGAAARARAEAEFSYDALAQRLAPALAALAR